jgi:hypothetical protein
MKQGNPVRELYYAITTKKCAPDLSLFDYWIWRLCKTRSIRVWVDPMYRDEKMAEALRKATAQIYYREN